MKIEIKSRWNASILFSIETETLKLALEAAVKKGADLRGADLRGARNDFFSLLIYSIPEIPALKQAVLDGKINGSVYAGEHAGDCACLVGTLEKSKRFKAEYGTLLRNSSRPIEKLFLAIKKGDTPETNQISKIVLEWIEDFEKHLVKIKEQIA